MWRYFIKNSKKMIPGWHSRFEFYDGVVNFNKLPKDNGSEVVFVGRSNVGKSSVINKITNRRRLAKISKLPGRTREVNYFIYEEGIYLVDLPGYGYARVSESKRHTWAKLIGRYLKERSSIKGVFMIMDIRRPIEKSDQVMLDYCESCNLPMHIILNKTDKLSRSAAMKTMFKIKKKINSTQTTFQFFSTLKPIGLEEARSQLEKWLFNS